jgi:hypothetical protein
MAKSIRRSLITPSPNDNLITDKQYTVINADRNSSVLNAYNKGTGIFADIPSEAYDGRAFTHSPDDGGSTDLCNAGKLTPVYTALQPP